MYVPSIFDTKQFRIPPLPDIIQVSVGKITLDELNLTSNLGLLLNLMKPFPNMNTRIQ